MPTEYRPDRPDQPEKPKRSRRIERREERRAMAAKIMEVKRVRVSPATEELRKSIAHPRLGGFRSAGSVEWPLDNFVKRRIKDGSIKVESAVQTKARNESRQESRQAGGSRPSRTPSGESGAGSPGTA
jgi:hypothetical protein